MRPTEPTEDEAGAALTETAKGLPDPAPPDGWRPVVAVFVHRDALGRDLFVSFTPRDVAPDLRERARVALSVAPLGDGGERP